MEIGLSEQSRRSVSYMGGVGCSKGGTKMHYRLLDNRGSFRTRNKDQKKKGGEAGKWANELSLFPNLRLAVHMAVFSDENQ